MQTIGTLLDHESQRFANREAVAVGQLKPNMLVPIGSSHLS